MCFVITDCAWQTLKAMNTNEVTGSAQIPSFRMVFSPFWKPPGFAEPKPAQTPPSMHFEAGEFAMSITRKGSWIDAHYFRVIPGVSPVDGGGSGTGYAVAGT
jgi:hypothetical protein